MSPRWSIAPSARTVLLHCNALSPDRWRRARWLALHRRFRAEDLDRDQAWELAVLLKTKGFLRAHHRSLFGWDRSIAPELAKVEGFFAETPSVLAAAEANRHSMTLADGLIWIKAVLELNPKYSGSVPLISNLAVTGLSRDDGMSDAAIAAVLTISDDFGGGTKGRAGRLVGKWRKTVLFDILSGDLRFSYSPSRQSF